MFAAKLFSLRGIQSQHAGETVHHLKPFCRSELSTSIGVHAQDPYF
jgi:hypothetical protein